jgi:hypothetical protein
MKSLFAVLAVAVALGAAYLPARADDYPYKRTFDLSTAANGASSIALTGYNGNVRLYADGGSMIRVHAIFSARSTDALKVMNVKPSQQGTTLHLDEVCGSSRHFLIWSFKDCEIDLEVHYPRGMAASVHNQNGNIVVSGAGDALQIDNSNGNVTIDTAGGGVSVKNTNGNVRIGSAPANVSVSDTNGNVGVTLAKNWRGRAIDLHTSAGNVHLTVPSNFAATYSTKTTLGNIENHAAIRNGPAKVSATTTFGNVIVSLQR